MFRTLGSRFTTCLYGHSKVERLIRFDFKHGGTLVRHLQRPKVKVQMVLLKDQAGKILGTKSKADAEALAKNRNCDLVLLTVSKAVKYPNYILVDAKTKTKLADEDIDGQPVEMVENVEKVEIKPGKPKVVISDVKRMALKSGISDHDVQVKVGQIMKWVEKMSEVRIVITGKTRPMMEATYSKFEKELPDVRMYQKVVRDHDLKFIVAPDPKKLDKYISAASTSTSASSTGNNRTSEVPQEGTHFIDLNDLFSGNEQEDMINENLKKK